MYFIFIIITQKKQFFFESFRLGRTRELPDPGNRVEFGLPQLQVGRILIHDTTPTHPGHDPVDAEIDSSENNHRGNTVRENVRSRPRDKIHVRVEQTQRVPAERVRRDDGFGEGRLRVHRLPQYRVGRPDHQTERKRHEHFGSGLLESGHPSPVQFPRRHTAEGRRFEYLSEAKASDHFDDHGRRTPKAVGLHRLRRR